MLAVHTIWASSPDAVSTDGLLNYGVLGVIVVLLIFGQLVPGFLYKRLASKYDTDIKAKEDELRAKDAEIARLNLYIQGQVIPAIIRFTDVQAATSRRRQSDDDDGR